MVGMNDEPLHLLAAARWLEAGATSATNPVHRRAFATFLQPFGLACEYLSCDPVSAMAICGELSLPILHGLRWDRANVDPGLLELFPEPSVSHLISLRPQCSGLFEITLEPAIPHELLPVVDRFGGGKRLNGLIAKARLATAKFIFRAFELACLPGAEEALSRALLADPAAFAELAAERLLNPAA
jgi:hypothetical protein